MKKARILPSFLNGISILHEIISSPNGTTQAEITKNMKEPPSNMTLYLNTLVNAGVVIRDPLTRKFFISPQYLELFRNTGESLVHHLAPCAEKPMQKLHQRFNENVLLAFRKDKNMSFIKHLISGHLVGIKFEPELDFPLHVTAAGRAVLAFLPEKEINAYIKTATFDKLTSKTVDNEKALRKILADTHKKGYAVNLGEFEEQIMAVAAPVLIDDQPIASLVVQFPTMRHTAKEAVASAEFIIEQARSIGKQLQKWKDSF